MQGRLGRKGGEGHVPGGRGVFNRNSDQGGEVWKGRIPLRSPYFYDEMIAGRGGGGESDAIKGGKLSRVSLSRL